MAPIDPHGLDKGGRPSRGAANGLATDPAEVPLGTIPNGTLPDDISGIDLDHGNALVDSRTNFSDLSGEIPRNGHTDPESLLDLSAIPAGRSGVLVSKPKPKVKESHSGRVRPEPQPVTPIDDSPSSWDLLGDKADPIPDSQESRVRFEMPSLPEGIGSDRDLAEVSQIIPQAVLAEDSSIVPYAGDVGPGASQVAIGHATAEPTAEPGRSSILGALIEEAKSRSSADTGAVADFTMVPVPDTPAHRSATPTMSNVGLSGGAATHPVISVTRETPYGGGSGMEWPAPGTDPDVLLPNSRAPEVEPDEAVDLYADAAVQAPSITDSGSLAIPDSMVEEAARRSHFIESSAVDLAAKPSFFGLDMNPNLEQGSDLGFPPQPSQGSGSEAQIDLNLPPIEDDGNSSLVHPYEALVANQAVLAAELEARRKQNSGSAISPALSPQRSEIIPGVEMPPPPSHRHFMIRGAVLGLMLGAGGVLAAYFGGALPNGRAATTDGAELTQLQQLVDATRKEVDESRALMASTQSAANAKIGELGGAIALHRKQADDALASASVAKAKQTEAEKAAAAAQSELEAARKAAEAAKADLTAAKSAAADAATAIAALKANGIDPAKPADGLKRLTDAAAAAESREKESARNLARATEAVTALNGQVQTARSSAEAARAAAADALRQKSTADATLKGVADRLARAKFAGDKADATAMLKGLDDALKAATTDATASLRDELAKARQSQAQASAEVTAAKDAAAKAVARADGLAKDLKTSQASATDAKADAARLEQEARSAATKAAEAEKALADLRRATTSHTNDLAQARAENARLAQDLDRLKELAAAIKSPGQPLFGPVSRPEPARIADRLFGEGLGQFFAGNYSEAETQLRKAIEVQADDARYHYVLGLSLWMRKQTKDAEAEFVRGRELELAGRPTSRAVNAVLERIQGPARHAVSSYRP